MMCQTIVIKAEKQLLSLCTLFRGRFVCGLGTKESGSQRNQHFISSQRNGGSVRSFSAVPHPPVLDNSKPRIDLDGREQDHERHCEAHDSQDVNEDGNGIYKKHVPVMANEVLSCLKPENNQLVIDMTFGAGGHASQILKCAPNIRYIGMDRDPEAFSLAQEFASKYRKGQVTPILGKFSELQEQLNLLNVRPGMVDGVIMDLGVSSMQFDSDSRGFGLSRDGPLDMRMDGQRFPASPTAADVVNTLDDHELALIIRKYGEERNARGIAHAIVEARYAFGHFTRTKQLADLIRSVFDSNFRHDKLQRHSHMATKTFQALRIFVNDELNEIHNGLKAVHNFLKPNGRCVVISFHSLEDRIVKRHFHGIDMDQRSNQTIHHYFRNSRVTYNSEEVKEKFLRQEWLPLKRKIFEPSEEEISRNPRARSAKLRAAIKVQRK